MQNSGAESWAVVQHGGKSYLSSSFSHLQPLKENVPMLFFASQLYLPLAGFCLQSVSAS